MTDHISASAAVVPAELEKSDWARLVWGFWWRGMAFVAASTLANFIVGFVVGFIAAFIARTLDIPPETYRPPLRVFYGLLGFSLGLILSVFYIRWLLRARFGSLKLTLVRVATDRHAA